VVLVVAQASAEAAATAGAGGSGGALTVAVPSGRSHPKVGTNWCLSLAVLPVRRGAPWILRPLEGGTVRGFPSPSQVTCWLSRSHGSPSGVLGASSKDCWNVRLRFTRTRRHPCIG
jgi:hypothetical protein